MGIESVVHPVKNFWITFGAKDEVTLRKMRLRTLLNGISQLKSIGRVSLEAKYDTRFSVINAMYEGYWLISTIYIGRKTILRNGIRHNLRKGVIQ